MIEKKPSCKIPDTMNCKKLQLANEKGDSEEVFEIKECNNCGWYEIVQLAKEQLKGLGIDVTGDLYEDNLNYLKSLLRMNQIQPDSPAPEVDTEAQKIATMILGGQDVKKLPAINDKIKIVEGLLKAQNIKFTNPEAIAVLVSMFLASKDKV